MSFLRKLPGLIGVGLLGAAIATELRKPAELRTWHGSLAGGIPYDLRPPTPEKFLEALWDPDNDQIFVPQPFGVGWTVNFGGLARRVGVLDR
jgi:hypothetical protein